MQKNEVIQSIRWNGIIFIIAGIIYSISAVPFLKSSWWWNELLSNLVLIAPIGFIIYLFKNPSTIKKIGETNTFLFLSFILLALIFWASRPQFFASWPQFFLARLIIFIIFGVITTILNTLIWFLLQKISSKPKEGMVWGLLGGAIFSIAFILWGFIPPYKDKNMIELIKYSLGLFIFILPSTLMVGIISGYFIGEKKRAAIGSIFSNIVAFAMFVGFVFFGLGH